MAKGLIAFGSNLGDRRATIDRAVAALDECPGIVVIERSHLYTSKPAGGPVGQDVYLNGALLLETELLPEQLLAAMQRVEGRLERKRERRWDARTIDLDLLLYEDAIIESESLVIPHPRMTFRAFVLEPAAEIAPEMEHPVIGWTLEKLRGHIDSADRLLTLVGSDPAEVERFAVTLCERLGCSLVPAFQGGSANPRLVAFGDPTGRRENTTIESSGVRAALHVALDKNSERWSPDGPLLRLHGMASGIAIDEVAAAIAAMEPVQITPL